MTLQNPDSQTLYALYAFDRCLILPCINNLQLPVISAGQYFQAEPQLIFS